MIFHCSCNIDMTMDCTMHDMQIKFLNVEGEGTGLLRLHSTYRHDLKIYSSDEGRVQVWAMSY